MRNQRLCQILDRTLLLLIVVSRLDRKTLRRCLRFAVKVFPLPYWCHCFLNEGFKKQIPYSSN